MCQHDSPVEGNGNSQIAIAVTTCKAKPLFLRSALRPAWSIFRDGTDQAYSLTLTERLRAGNFASLVAQRREPVRLGQNKTCNE